MNRIEKTFSELELESRTALMPYLPLGFPTTLISQQLIRTVAEAGADVIELGIPFSDPLADGPVIQQATQIALRNGTTLATCLDMVRTARAEGVSIPLVLMGYYNPILRFGIEKFAAQAREAGADGVIVPDLPPEEAVELRQRCDANSLSLIFLAAPTSTNERLRMIADATGGFVYLVSLTGVTGAREALPVELEGFVKRVRAQTAKPLCVGFGISGGESARQIAEFADGVIVGSALVSRIGDPSTALGNAHRFVAEMRLALDQTSKVGKKLES